MASTDSTSFPLVEINPISNMHNAWVALSLRIAPAQGDAGAGLHRVFASADLLVAIAPLDCIVMLDSPDALTDSLLALMPPRRVGFCIPARAMQTSAQTRRVVSLQDTGHRVLLNGPPAVERATPVDLRAVADDHTDNAGKIKALPPVFGPHLAYGVNNAGQLAKCARAGYEWFAGDYPLHPEPSPKPDDGSSRKRLMTLLGLLARDAETRDLENLLKQDPALSYHLLKLANSAAFAHAAPITSFGQAISVLGRRQLQRWLQLLLYARHQPDGVPNALLPLAGLRAAQMEALCKLRGGERDDQDLAFMTGVFSLLDLLFGLPMAEIVGALNLPQVAADALLRREGPLGQLLLLVESRRVTPAMLDQAGFLPTAFWQTQLLAYHWAIQVSRNL